jgi:YcaO-like protein with predicted kinase domain
LEQQKLTKFAETFAQPERKAQAGSAKKAYSAETHRTISPAETIARAKPLMKKMGITRIANVTGLDRIGIPVVMVTRPNSRSVAVSQGKGLTFEAAAASGVMEAIETWHAERVQHPVKYASFADLSNEYAVVDVSRLPQVRGSRFNAGLRLLWIEGEDIAQNRKAWVPYEMVHTDYTHPTPSGHGCFECSTNGLASGNHILEAQCHAICEVIERDALSIWHNRPADMRAGSKLALETVDDPYCRQALAQLAAAGLDVFVWSTTSDIKVPSFFCLIIEKDNFSSHPGAGSGCHPSSGIALLRALTEAVQTRMTYISGARDDLSPEEFTPQGIQQKHQMVQKLAGPDPAELSFLHCPSNASGDFKSDRAWLLNCLKSVGIDEIVCVDLSREEIGIPVVRVVVPGLEAPHDEDDYVPGPRAQAAARGAL